MSIAGVVGIAAFSFSETLSVLSLSGNSNNSAEIILQGRKKDFFFFFGPNHTTYFSHPERS